MIFFEWQMKYKIISKKQSLRSVKEKAKKNIIFEKTQSHMRKSKQHIYTVKQSDKKVPKQS